MDKKLFTFLIFGLLLISCKKEITVPNSGIFRGVFREYSATGDTLATGVVYMALNENDLTFNVSGDSTTNAPANHAGNYLVDNSTTMQFINNTAYSQVYDADHYLDTSYNFTFDDTNFKIWQTISGKLYEYDLVRN